MYISGLVSALAKAPRPKKQKTRERYVRRWPSRLRSFWPLVVAAFRSSLFVAACEEKQLVFTFNGTLAFIFRPRPCLFSDSRSIKGHAAAGSQRRRRRRRTVAPNGKNPPEHKYTCCNLTIFVSRQISSSFHFGSLHALYSEFVNLVET